MTDAPSAPASAGQANEGQGTQTLNPAWYERDGVTDEVKGYIQNKGWKDDPIKVVNAYQNLEKYHGVPAEQLIKLPKDGEPMDPVYDRLGRPESADKYDIKMPEGIPADEARLSGFKDIAHKIGLNQKQVEALAAFDAEYMGSVLSAHQAETEQKQAADIANLKREWGQAYEERSELGRRAVRAFLPDGDKGGMLNAIEGAIGTANMLKLFSNIGQKIGEDKIHDATPGDRPFGFTPEMAKARLEEIKTEIKGDKARLEAYNQGKGKDYEEIKRLNALIHS